MGLIKSVNNIDLSDDFKLKFGIEHQFKEGTFEQKYIDHFCNDVKLTNMNEFIGSRLHYQEFGIYTKATPNGHPNSQWMKFWKEEKRRCIEGYNIGRDWIPGYLYFYWNYTPIWRVKEISQEEGQQRKRAERIFSFPDIYDSDYYWFHYLEEAEKRGMHGANIKKRGIGFSFKGGSMMNRNYFLIPGSKSYAFADQKEYLIKDGILTKAWELMDWLDDNTAWTKRRLKKTEMHKKAGFEKVLQSGAKIEAGYKSEIIGVTLEGDSDKARGKRGKLILWEESGNNKALRQAWVVARSSMEEDDSTYGLMVAGGTGGTVGANFEGLEELIRKPAGYNVYGIPNIFEGRDEQTGFFIPTYLNRRGCMDSNGNSDIVKAVVELDNNRKNTRRNMSTNIYLMTIAEHPYTIDEAVLRMEGSPFDVATAKEVLGELAVKPAVSKKGTFALVSGKPEFRINMDLVPVDEYHFSGRDSTGCWVIYEEPIKVNGEIPAWRYCAGNDPIDWGTDESSSTGNHSMAATYIIDTITRDIVAEYISRPRKADDYFEQLWRGIEWYNGTLLYENNLKSLFSYFKMKNKLYLLSREPESLKSRFGYKSNNRTLGFHATKEANSYARELIHTWSLEEVLIDQTEDGEPVFIPRMYNIKSKGLLEEIIAWNSKGNFDRISSLGAAMVLLFDRNYDEDDMQNTSSIMEEGIFLKMRDMINKQNKFKF